MCTSKWRFFQKYGKIRHYAHEITAGCFGGTLMNDDYLELSHKLLKITLNILMMY